MLFCSHMSIHSYSFLRRQLELGYWYQGEGTRTKSCTLFIPRHSCFYYHQLSCPQRIFVVIYMSLTGACICSTECHLIATDYVCTHQLQRLRSSAKSFTSQYEFLPSWSLMHTKRTMRKGLPFDGLHHSSSLVIGVSRNEIHSYHSYEKLL